MTIISEALASDSYESDLDYYDGKIVRTAETTDNFKETNLWQDIKRDYFTGKGIKGDLILGYQYEKGDARVDLMILDFGDSRAVVELN